MERQLYLESMRRWTYSFMSDEALIGAYAKGRSQAFDCLYRRHKQGLYKFLSRQCSNSHICEELAHDTWLAVINRASSFTPQARFKTWLFRIAHNRLVDHWRKHASDASRLYEEVSESVLVSEDDSTQQLELQQLLSSLEALSKEQMATLLLKIEGFSHAEIAAITDAKRETVKSRLRYAINRLRMTAGVTS